MNGLRMTWIKTAAICVTTSLASIASAATVGFDAITNNSGISGTVDSQFTADVTNEGGGVVSFKFNNAGPVDSFIAQVYWDDDLGLFTGFNTLASNWDTPATPPNVPNGNSVGFFADLGADADNPQAANGIDVGEMAVFLLDLDVNGGATFADVIFALQSGDLRLGMHVQGIQPSGQSDSFVISAPLPAGVWMGLALLGGVGAAKRSRRTT